MLKRIKPLAILALIAVLFAVTTGASADVQGWAVKRFDCSSIRLYGVSQPQWVHVLVTDSDSSAVLISQTVPPYYVVPFGDFAFDTGVAATRVNVLAYLKFPSDPLISDVDVNCIGGVAHITPHSPSRGR